LRGKLVLSGTVFLSSDAWAQVFPMVPTNIDVLEIPPMVDLDSLYLGLVPSSVLPNQTVLNAIA
jgi:hypothetical protein